MPEAELVDQVRLSRSAARRARRVARARWMLLRLRHPLLRTCAHPMACAGGGRWRVREGAKISNGPGVAMREDYDFFIQGELTLGTRVFFNRNAYVSVMRSVRIGDDVRFGERCSIHDENHVFEPIPVAASARLQYTAAPVEIGNRVWIGSNTVVLAGAVIGDDTVIAANSVVRGQIPAGVVAGGTPARVLRELR